MAVVLGIRHAEVENPRNLVYGRLAGFPLSAAGLEASRDLGRLLSRAPVVAVYASPLDRARQTADALASPHGLPVPVEPRLIEWIAREDWQGRLWADLVASEEYARVGEEDPLAAAPEDPLDRAGERVLAWAREAAVAHADGIVLGVSHEAPLVAAYVVGRGASLRDYRRVHVPLLSGVRLEPGPPELVDPAQALGAC